MPKRRVGNMGWLKQRSNAVKRLSLQLMIPPKHYYIFSSDRGMLRMSACVQVFLERKTQNGIQLKVVEFPYVGRMGSTICTPYKEKYERRGENIVHHSRHL